VGHHEAHPIRSAPPAMPSGAKLRLPETERVGRRDSGAPKLSPEGRLHASAREKLDGLRAAARAANAGARAVGEERRGLLDRRTELRCRS
jgi:hypothetical protein